MSTHYESPTEWERLATVTSVAAIVAGQVSDFVQLRRDQFPGWLLTLGVPAGWRIARYSAGISEISTPAAPSRIAIATPQTHSVPGYGCETVTVFGFTGSPVIQAVYDNAGCSLRALGATDILCNLPETPPAPAATAVRSSGYITADGVSMWAQYSNYIVVSRHPNQGRLVQQCLFVGSAAASALERDIAELSDATYRSFFSAAVALTDS
jgi:hypothetical protein